MSGAAAGEGPAAAAPAVEARDLCLTYPIEAGPLHALADVDLVVERGGITSLVGPSGCGKTALLRLAAGLERPSSGLLRIEGTTPEAARREGLAAFVPAEPELQPHHDVEDNVRYGLDVLVEDPEARRRRVAECLSLMALDGFEGRRIDALSDGMRRRVAIAKALAPGPRLLLVDDAFRGADGFVREALAELLRGLRRRAGVSILFATTSIHEAVHVGDRVAAMAAHPGRILEIVEVPLPDARPPECREDPAFVEAARRVRAALRAGRVYDA